MKENNRDVFPCGAGDRLGENERLVGSRRLVSVPVVHSAQDLAVLRSPYSTHSRCYTWTPKDRDVAPSILQADERKMISSLAAEKTTAVYMDVS